MTLIDGVYTDLEKPLLYIHILAGFVSLGTAYLLLFLKKGDKRHKKYGMYYVYGMSTIFVTAIPLSMMGVVQPFLFAIAIFSFYFAFAGFRQQKSGLVLGRMWIKLSHYLCLLPVYCYF